MPKHHSGRFNTFPTLPIGNDSKKVSRWQIFIACAGEIDFASAAAEMWSPPPAIHALCHNTAKRCTPYAMRAHRGFPGKGARCSACGEGVFRPTNVQVRTFSHRDKRNIEISEPMMLPVCTKCGEIRLNDADLALMDADLEREFEATRLAIEEGLEAAREGRHRPVSEVFAVLRAKMRSESQLASFRERVAMSSRDELPGPSLPASVTEDPDIESSA